VPKALKRVVVASFLIATAVHAQSILTVAGGGPIGDGGPATAALLREPWDTAIDAAGNLYISDTKNHRIRMQPALVADRLGNHHPSRTVDGNFFCHLIMVTESWSDIA
jgi:hypothetical protein